MDFTIVCLLGILLLEHISFITTSSQSDKLVARTHDEPTFKSEIKSVQDSQLSKKCENGINCNILRTVTYYYNFRRLYNISYVKRSVGEAYQKMNIYTAGRNGQTWDKCGTFEGSSTVSTLYKFPCKGIGQHIRIDFFYYGEYPSKAMTLFGYRYDDTILISNNYTWSGLIDLYPSQLNDIQCYHCRLLLSQTYYFNLHRWCKISHLEFTMNYESRLTYYQKTNVYIGHGNGKKCGTFRTVGIYSKHYTVVCEGVAQFVRVEIIFYNYGDPFKTVTVHGYTNGSETFETCMGEKIGEFYQYTGTKHVTKSGHLCRRWESVKKHDKLLDHYTWFNESSDSNYCRTRKHLRNVKEPRPVPWCYIMDTTMRWEECNITKCVNVDGDWSSWINGNCSATCFDGTHKPTMIKKRDCDNPRPQYDGKICRGNDTDIIECDNITECPVDGSWSLWINGNCSATCIMDTDIPTLNKIRECDNPRPQYGGKNCTGKDIDIIECDNITVCPDTFETCMGEKVGGFHPYTGSKHVTKSGHLCKRWDHLKTHNESSDDNYCRTREHHKERPVPWCYVVDPMHWEECNITKCVSVDGGWNSWMNETCSATCSDGTNKPTRNIKRDCNNPRPKYGGKNCTGNDTDIIECDNIIRCPVDGGWSSWINGNCSATCFDDINKPTINKTRECNNPSPQYGGKNCIGNVTDIIECDNLTECPVDGGWSSWMNETCSATCSDGTNKPTRNIKRDCNSPRPKYGGKNCTGNDTDIIECVNIDECPVDGGWSSWINGNCSATCFDDTNKPTMNKKRECNSPSPQHGGKNCKGNATDIIECDNIHECPVDGGWSLWINGTCSATCFDDTNDTDKPTMTIIRECNNPRPQYSGKNCIGNNTDIIECNNITTCPDFSVVVSYYQEFINMGDLDLYVKEKICRKNNAINCDKMYFISYRLYLLQREWHKISYIEFTNDYNVAYQKIYVYLESDSQLNGEKCAAFEIFSEISKKQRINCKGVGKYVRLDVNFVGSFPSQKYEAFGYQYDDTNLISFNKSTFMSSTYENDISSNGVDGKENTKFKTLYHDHSNYWEIDLSGIWNISFVSLHTVQQIVRNDTYGDLQNISIYISKAKGTFQKRCAYFGGPDDKKRTVYTLLCEGIGRYVRVEKAYKGHLELREVEVFGSNWPKT